MKKTLITVLISSLSGLGGAFIYSEYFSEEQSLHNSGQIIEEKPVYKTEQSFTRAIPDINFREASNCSTPSVVYIKTIFSHEYETINLLDWFFNGGTTRRTQEVISSGSGVIYTKDGYIITNNHVIDNSQKIMVNIGKRNYEAEVIGTDPGTDIAVIKIKEKNLPAIKIGSSKELQVGDWVLAVGNPFNLTSTVTAGIVSAKGRDLNKLSNRFPIDFFIQTDAAINPGNSGGALVNLGGELVGINTAILSPSGAFSGYGFAVPVDIAKKVADDLIQYGRVQKATLGIEIQPVTEKVADKLNLENLDGVVINHVEKNFPADKIGLEAGDIILKIDNNIVDTESEFDEQLSYYRPGDKIKLVYKRKSDLIEKEITLTNVEGTTDLIRRIVYESEFLGAELEEIPNYLAKQLRINSGIRINSISSGLFRDLGLKEGFIITAINGNSVKQAKEIEKILKNVKGRVRIEGINNNNIRGFYSFYF